MKIISRLLVRKPAFDAPIAPETPFYAVGDIHGCDVLLTRLLERLEQEQHPDAGLVFVGDYIDRGEDSAAVLRRLYQLERASDGACVCLMGNHEQMLVDFLDKPERGPRWLRNGGLQTLASFGLRPISESASAEDWETARDALRKALGQPLEFWLRRLNTIYRSGNIAVTHAGADPNARLSEQQHSHLIWGHPDFQTTQRQDGRWVVHGHTIVDEPKAERGRISVDTGAYATGRLTAALVEEGSVRFLTA